MAIDPSAIIQSHPNRTLRFERPEEPDIRFSWTGDGEGPTLEQVNALYARVAQHRERHPNSTRGFNLAYRDANGIRGQVHFPPVRTERRPSGGGDGDSFSRGGVRSPSTGDNWLARLFAPRNPRAGVGLRGAAVGRQQRGPRGPGEVVMMNSGAIRNDPLSGTMQRYLNQMADDLGLRVEVYSGGQEAAGEGGNRTGTDRHDHGRAADVRIYRDGELLAGDALNEVVAYWLEQGWGGVGFGMNNGATNAGLHLDEHRDRARFWAYDGTTLPPAVRQTVAHYIPSAPALHYA